MIELKDVCKKIGGTQVLSHLSLKIPQGSTRALLGLSGSGKSTILKLISGLEFPDSGEVIVPSALMAIIVQQLFDRLELWIVSPGLKK